MDLGRQLSAIAPTYFVTGNHEWALPDPRGLKRALGEAGVTVLDNRFVTLERGGDQILLAGIDDPNGFADQKTPEELAQEVSAAWGDGFWILLAQMCIRDSLRAAGVVEGNNSPVLPLTAGPGGVGVESQVQIIP